MSQFQQQYLDAMGITVWQQRKTLLPIAESESANPETHAVSPALINESELPIDQLISTPSSVDVACLTWSELEQAVADCQQCSLCEGRSQSVLGEGDRQARLMFVGAMPDANEDQQGKPIVDRSGILFNAMLQSIGVNRQQIYVTHLNKCRAPADRAASAGEVTQCEVYLQRQIALLQPSIIVLLGGAVAQALLKTEASLNELRGLKVHFGDQQIPLMVIEHPSFLLTHRIGKRQAWQDLRQLQQWLTEVQEA